MHQIVDWEIRAEEARFNARNLANLCGVCARQLQRFFREAHGLSPQKWLDQRRIVRAIVLLGQGASVKEVAHQLEFRQRSHFSRKFKRAFGIPPSRIERLLFLPKSLIDTTKSPLDTDFLYALLSKLAEIRDAGSPDPKLPQGTDQLLSRGSSPPPGG